MRERGHPDDLLSAFLDDELDEPDASHVTRHLATCDTCLSELDGLREARAALRGLPEIPPPSSLFSAIPDAAAEAGSRDWGRRAATGVAAGLAVLLAAAFVLGESQPGEVVPPVDVVVVDHVVRTGGGPVIQPVVLDR